MSLMQEVLVTALLGQHLPAAEAFAPMLAVGGPIDGRFWAALLLGVIALCLLLPATTRSRQLAGTVLGLLSLLLIFTGLMVPLLPRSEAAVFWALATVTIVSSVAAMATPKPVHTALWFALSLLGTSGLMLFDGAQFLSVSTAAVYAGAIVVTFLFVLMLAQPEGHAAYDRITWGWYARSAAALLAACLVGVLTIALRLGIEPDVSTGAGSVAERDVLHAAHMARFGTELFTRHLLSLEVVGGLLLIALVGSLSIMLQAAQTAGTPPRGPES